MKRRSLRGWALGLSLAAHGGAAAALIAAVPPGPSDSSARAGAIEIEIAGLVQGADAGPTTGVETAPPAASEEKAEPPTAVIEPPQAVEAAPEPRREDRVARPQPPPESAPRAATSRLSPPAAPQAPTAQLPEPENGPVPQVVVPPPAKPWKPSPARPVAAAPAGVELPAKPVPAKAKSRGGGRGPSAAAVALAAPPKASPALPAAPGGAAASGARPDEAGPPAGAPSLVALPPAGVGGRERATAAGRDHYLALVQHLLERQKRYPRRAQLLHLEGTVLLAFTVDRTGRVLAYRIERSSGQPLLDAEVEAMLRRAQPLPAPPDLAAGTLELLLPVDFSLR